MFSYAFDNNSVSQFKLFRLLEFGKQKRNNFGWYSGFGCIWKLLGIQNMDDYIREYDIIIIHKKKIE